MVLGQGTHSESEVRAAVCHAFGAPLDVQEILLASPGRDELGIRVEACAICHSDVAYADGAWGGDLPAVFGHEVCGVVEEVGAGVDSRITGQRVVVCLVRYCGRCARCQAGEPALCTSSFRLDHQSPISSTSGKRIGQGLRCGGFAERVTVHHSQALPLPEEIPPTSGCLIACAVMTGLGAVENTVQVAAGSTVIVIGAGGVGLNAVQGAALAGAPATRRSAYLGANRSR